MKYNKSKTYLLPLLSEFINFETKFMKYLVNTYMFDETGEYGECLCILHDFNFKNPEFTAYEHRFTNNDLFIKSIDIGNKVLYIFKFPEEYKQEYYSLYEGKYSEFGNDAKELILKFWADVYNGNANAVNFLVKVKQVLYKDSKLREKLQKDLRVTIDEEQELGDIIDVDNETFKTELINQ